MELRQAYDMVGENEQCHSKNKPEGDLLTKATTKIYKDNNGCCFKASYSN